MSTVDFRAPSLRQWDFLYRSPNSSNENNEKLLNVMSKIEEMRGRNILLMGDFNFPEIDWELEMSSVGEERWPTKFLNATKDAFLVQHQTEKTRHRQGEQSNLLDLVFTSREDIINEILTIAGLGKSDHSVLVIDFVGGMEIVRNEERRFDFKRADYAAMRKDLAAIDWNKELEKKSTEESWTVKKTEY